MKLTALINQLESVFKGARITQYDNVILINGGFRKASIMVNKYTDENFTLCQTALDEGIKRYNESEKDENND